MPGGFLPARGSFMLDLVCVAMVLVMIVLPISIGLVRYRKRYRLHRALQLTTAAVLLLAVIAFEIDMRFVTDWRKLAEGSRYYESGWVDRLLVIHLCFAIPTPFLWLTIIAGALWNFRGLTDQGPTGNAKTYAYRHRILGRCGTAMMVMTAVTGWLFYWTAFVC